MKTRPSRDPSRRHYKDAFTLVEAIMAVAVVAIMFVSLYLSISFSYGVTGAERENLRATQVILQRMEGIRLFNWNQLTDTTLNPTSFSERYLPASAGVAASGLTYTGQMTIAPVTLDPAATYSGNMKKVTVTVTWTSRNVLHTRSAFTYVAKDGVQNYIYSN